MNVIGLGQAGCKIVEKLENYEQYNKYYIDVENNGYTNFYAVEHQNTHQNYEKNYKKIKLKGCEGETTVFLSGAGDISGAALRLLQQLKNNILSVIYIKADETPLSEIQRLKDRVVSQILQQYARSGKLKRLYLISNKMVEEIVGDLSIKNYWDQINNTIASTFHMFNIFANTEPLLKSMPTIPKTSKISTFGVVNYKTGSEKLFYDMKLARVKSYFYNLNEETLEGEKDTLNKIRSFVSERAEEKVSVGFSIYPTDYNENYVYSIYDASLVQEQNIK
tara:strand:- start:1114 stop:1947 length:834 start_codon:yes stop_codon:yes gene_type:complete